MKNQLSISPRQEDPALEKIIQLKDAELKEMARRNARHFAKRNLPSPTEGEFSHFTGDIKTGYEKLYAEVYKAKQPDAHFPEAKMDGDYFKDKDAGLSNKIKTLEDENHTDKYELENFHQGILPLKLWLVLVGTLVIFSGEVVFNAKAFQVITESLLFALVLSVAISFCVLVGSHYAAFRYKDARTTFKRRMIVLCSLASATIVFIVIARIRSLYLLNHDIDINPLYFVVFNLFLFVISAVLSFALLPTWHEVKEEIKHLRLDQAVKKRERQIEALHSERGKIRDIVLERTKQRMRIVHYMNDTAEQIRKMYFETIEVFKNTNLIYRTDRKTPDCFSQIPDEPNIEDVTLSFISTNRINK